MRTVVLISGQGTNLQAIIDAMQAGQLPITIPLVISNEPKAYGLSRATNAGIPTQIIPHKAFQNREAFDHALAEAIDAVAADLIVLAGFMRILSKTFVHRYAGRLINIHPSLLPKYKGLDTHRQAIDAGDLEHGASAHFVTADLDGGPLIAQARLSIRPSESSDELKLRVNSLEHRLYPYTIDLIANKRLELVGDTVIFDGSPLTKNGIMLNL